MAERAVPNVKLLADSEFVDRLQHLEEELAPEIDRFWTATDTTSWPNLVIDHNSVAENSPCPVCGQPTNEAIGPQVMIESNKLPVCKECGLKYAPNLLRVVLIANMVEGYFWDRP